MTPNPPMKIVIAVTIPVALVTSLLSKWLDPWSCGWIGGTLMVLISQFIASERTKP